MSYLSFDYSNVVGTFIGENELENMQPQINAADDLLRNGKGAGSEYLGWIDLPSNYDKEEFSRIQQAAQKIQKNSELLIVIGIGGSYLGAKAALDFLNHSFYNLLDSKNRQTPQILFAGNNINFIK